MIRFFPSYRRRTLEREEGEEFSLEWKASFARTRAFLPAWNGGFVGRLAWIQRFNDVKTRGGAKARPVISSLPVSSRNFICLIGEGEGRRGETPLESLERSCTRSLSLSLSKGERIHWRNTRAWLLRLAPVVDQPDRYYAISSGLKW